ncbi:SAM-dependent methyltransferase [Cryptosporangium sp. NPDC048952]|uniref:SAM-dependent methyltransferase n=1 Tax=Cryptosporangium sp. NPDC048952 TaxID=3363961 RepID=UPI003718AD88
MLTHARALLRGGGTAYLEADFRQPATILAQAAATLDFEKPVAVMLIALLHLVRDEESPYEHVAALVEALAPGSYLVISHGTADFVPEEVRAKVAAADARTANPSQVRSQAEIARFFEGFEVLEPGIVPVSEWRNPGSSVPAIEASCYGAVGRRIP